MVDKLTEGVDEALKKLDEEFEEKFSSMLTEPVVSPETPIRNGDTPESISITSDELDMIYQRRELERKAKERSEHQKPDKNSAQLFEAVNEDLEKVKNRIEEGTDNIYKGFLDILVSTSSYSSASERFLQVISEQLKLPEVNLKTDRLRIITDSLVDVKCLILLINTITNNEYKDDIKSLEISLYERLSLLHFNLLPKDINHAQQIETNHILKENFKDLQNIIQKSFNKQNDILYSSNKLNKKL